MRHFLFYTPSMWRRHLYNYVDEEELIFDLNVFGYVGNHGKDKIFRTMKKLMLYEPETGKSFLLKSQESKNYLYIVDSKTSIDARGVPSHHRLPKCYEGETIGYIRHSDTYSRFPDLLYNCRVCLEWEIFISDNCSNLVEMDRSELLSYTRQHYYQLIKLFDLPPLQLLLNAEKNNSSTAVKKVWESYFR